MSSNRWLLVSSLGLSMAIACAKADEQNPDSSTGDDEHGGGGAQNAGAGKANTAGSSSVSEGGKAGSVGNGGAGTSSGSGGKAGSASGGSGGAKGGSGGAAGAGGGGKAGGANGGSANGGKAGSGGTASAGTSTGGAGSNGVGCNVEAAGGAASADGGAPANDGLFFDDFETAAATKWTTTLGTWAIVDDGSKAYDQSLQENKLQIAIANGACAADQIIDAKVKVVGFKGQSNSYVAALFGRVVSSSTHYLLALGSDDKLVLRKRVNSSSTGATAIGSAVALTVNEGQWYDVHFELVGTSLKGCVGAVCVTGTDSSIASGSVGVGTVNTSARFDDVRLTAP